VSNAQAGLLPLRLGFVKAFLVRDEGKHVLVDTGTAGSSKKIIARLERVGVCPCDIGLIVVTHVHPDHTGGLAELVKATGAKVAVHRLEAEHPGTRVEPDNLVDEELDLKPYGVAGKVIWTPGHTRGSVSVMLESGEAIVGDLVLPRFMSFGPPAIAFWAASREDSIASIRKVLDLRPSIILTSHGGPYQPEALARLAS
jgi:hydroxyacylglutathione hydrolase